MRHIIFALALLCAAAALAQGTTPATTPAAAADKPAGAQPVVGDKPLVQVGKKAAGKKGEKAATPGKPQSAAQKLQSCQDID
ncbi:hypothetical protein SB18R_24390, partial [Pseudomonas oryzihabitans]